MTVKITCIFFLMPCLLAAQIQWEHTYSGTNISLERRMLDQSGEIYLLSNSCSLELYTKDHLPWKNISLSPVYGDHCGFYLLSEKLADNDPEIEVIYNWALVDHIPNEGVVLQDDNGQITFLNQQNPRPKFTTFPGLSPKLTAGSVVYSLPGPVVEHNYGTNKRVFRIQLQDGSERYLVYDLTETPFAGFQFYNASHELVKTAAVPKDLTYFSQNISDQDDLFEFAGKIRVEDSGVNRFRLNIVQEDNTLLHSIPCDNGYLNQIKGLPDRYFLYYTTPQGTSATRVIGLSPWKVLADFEQKFVSRYALNGTEEVFTVQAKNGDYLILLFDKDFKLINTFSLPEPYRHFWNLQFSRNKFSSSNLLEICFSNERQGETFVTCIDQYGQLLYEFPGALEARLDHQPSMEDRFFVQYYDSTAVYRFDQSTGTKNIWLSETQLSPNPAKIGQQINIDFAPGVQQADLYSIIGQFVRSWPLDPQQESHQLDLSGSALQPGLYLVQLMKKPGQPLAVLKCVLTE